MKKATLLFILLTFLVGCATTYNPAKYMSRLRLGMSEEEVVNIMGRPYYVSAKDNIKYFTYRCDPLYCYGEYFVRFVNGKVEAYGKVGDFGYTRPPKQVIDLNIQMKNKQSP